MLNASQLVQSAAKNSLLKSWNILGPYDFDVSDKAKGLSFFEKNSDGKTGRKEFAEIFENDLSVLDTNPSEGDAYTVYSIESNWSFLRSPEEVYSFGNFHTYNCFGAVFAHSILSTEADSVVSFRLVQRSPARMIVCVDGKRVFDNENINPTPDSAGYTYGYFCFDALVKAAGSSVMIAVAKMGRWTDVGFALSSTSHALEARTALPTGVTLKQRQDIENALGNLEIEREFYYDGDDIIVISDAFDGVSAKAELCATGFTKTVELTSGRNIIAKADEISRGDMKLTIVVTGANGISAATEYSLYKMSHTEQLPGYENLEQRKRIYLEHLLNVERGAGHGNSDSYIIATYYYLEHYDKITMKLVKDACDYIRARHDCSDFRIQSILRVLYWDSTKNRLPQEIVQYMKDTVLGFKYWQDEPGNTVMFFSSENHRMLFHVAEYLAGQLYPTDMFTNSGQNGMYHSLKGRTFIMEWLRDRGRYGFTEFHSNNYFNITMAPLLNVLDFIHPDDGPMRFAVKQIIDYMTLILAINTYEGILATAHSRTYAQVAKHPENEGCTSLMYILYGRGCLKDNQGYGSFEIATGTYKLPELFDKMANDTNNRLYYKWQQSRWQQEIGIMERVTARFAVYRTPYVQMSAMLDYDYKGEHERFLHVAHVGLPDKIAVFWNTPWSSSETSGMRPNYWAGNAVVPRTFQEKNVIGLIFKGKRYNWITHCFFEKARFDEVEQRGNWVFGAVKGSYVGIYSQNGIAFTDSGPYKNRELVAAGSDNIWLCECGDVENDGSFAKFVERLSAAEVVCNGDSVAYNSPSIGLLKAAWEGPVTLNGDVLELNNLPTVESDWVNGNFGEPHLRITYKGHVEDMWFD